MSTLPLSPDDLLTTTRTVRKRLDLDRPVPLELVRECLEVALQAPSGSNLQGWQWVVVTDPAKREAIAELYREEFAGYRAAGATAANQFADDPTRAAVQQRVGDSADWLAEHMGQVPVLVIPCIRGGSSLPEGNQSAFWGSILPAAWSYCLAARARGLGTAWTTLHLGKAAEVAQLLGIPDKYYQAALIPTAYYTGDSFKPAHRAPLEQILHVDTW